MTELTPRGDSRPGPRPPRNSDAFEAMWGNPAPGFTVLQPHAPAETTADDNRPDTEPDPMRRLARRLFPKPTEN